MDFDNISRSLITNGLIAFNAITTAWDFGYKYSVTTVKGIIDSHTSSIWVFRQRNNMPWVVKSGWMQPDKIRNGISMEYYPSENKFIVESGFVKKRFDDIVTVELLRIEDAGIVYDMSAFFHELFWTSKGYASASASASSSSSSAPAPPAPSLNGSVPDSSSPSIYEMALVYTLTQNAVVRLEDYTVRVNTISETILISLNSEKARLPFTDWNVFTETPQL